MLKIMKFWLLSIGLACIISLPIVNAEEVQPSLQMKVNKSQIDINESIEIVFTIRNTTNKSLSFVKGSPIIDFINENGTSMRKFVKTDIGWFPELHKEDYFELTPGAEKDIFIKKMTLHNGELNSWEGRHFHFVYNGYYLEADDYYILLEDATNLIIKAEYKTYDSSHSEIDFAKNVLKISNMFEGIIKSREVEIEIEP